MAEAITKGLVGELPLDKTIGEQSDLYAVCVGAYTRKNADRILEEVKLKGYKDAYLISR